MNVDMFGKASEWDGPRKYGLLWAGYSYEKQTEQPDYPNGFEFAANYRRIIDARRQRQSNDVDMTSDAGAHKRHRK